jgi:hypothetical protein
MDSAFYNGAVIGPVGRQGAFFPVTAPTNSSIRAAIGASAEQDWTPVRYPCAI